MRTAIYSRVSTSHHDQKPEVQQVALRTYCANRGWTLSADLVDHGYSGGTDKRPALVDLLRLARSREIDAIVVTKMDRLFRSLKHLCATLEELSALGIVFVSLHEQIDMSSASGRLMAQILGAFSEFERSMIRERTLHGLAYARSKGKRLGRPITRQDELIRAFRAKGMTYTQIQQNVGCSRGAVYRSLKAVSKTPERSAAQVRNNAMMDGEE